MREREEEREEEREREGGGERGWGRRELSSGVRRLPGEWEAFESFLLSRSSDTTDVNIGTPDYSWERKRRRKRRSRKRRRGSRKKERKKEGKKARRRRKRVSY